MARPSPAQPGPRPGAAPRNSSRSSSGTHISQQKAGLEENIGKYRAGTLLYKCSTVRLCCTCRRRKAGGANPLAAGEHLFATKPLSAMSSHRFFIGAILERPLFIGTRPGRSSLLTTHQRAFPRAYSSHTTVTRRWVVLGCCGPSALSNWRADAVGKHGKGASPRQHRQIPREELLGSHGRLCSREKIQRRRGPTFSRVPPPHWYAVCG